MPGPGRAMPDPYTSETGFPMHILLSGILLAAQAAAPAVQRSDPPAVAAAKAVLADEKYVRPPEAIARLTAANQQVVRPSGGRAVGL